MIDTSPPRWSIARIAILFEGGLAILGWVLGWWLELPALGGATLSLTAIGLGIAACLPMVLAFVLILGSQLPPFRKIRALCDEIIRPMFASCTVLDLALISLLAGLGEEMLFRAILQAWTANRVGVWGGLLIASFVFGMLHAITPAYVVIATSFGLYLGWLWILTDNLLVSIITHAVYDFVVLVYLLKLQNDRSASALEL